MEQFWEGLEDHRLHGEAPSALFESAALDCLVRVLEQVQRCLRVQRIEKGLVAHLNPVDHLSEVFCHLPSHLVEACLGQQSVEIFEPQRKWVLQSGLVEVDNRFGEGVFLEVAVVRTVEGARASKKQSDWQLRSNVVLLALLVVQKVHKSQLMVTRRRGKTQSSILVSRVPEAGVEGLVHLVLKRVEVASTEAAMDQICKRRAHDTPKDVSILLQTGPANSVLSRLDQSDQVILVLRIESTRWEIFGHVPREAN